VSQPYYVTTPIYYINDVPHIGHAYTTVAADVLARWHRMSGRDVRFLTGTDEHGLKIQRAAEAKGITPRELGDETSAVFRSVWDSLDITYDDFIRTSEPRHYQAAQAFMQKMYDAGDIELRIYEGQYCVPCEAYYNDDELVDGNCPIHMRPVEQMREENYFFLLSKYEDRLLDFYENNPEAVRPATRRNEVLGFIKQGLQDFSVSRTTIDWGVPLPWDPNHVAYVWADALVNYCTSLEYGTGDDTLMDRYWPEVHHIVGKDILRFHAVYWPAMLMSAGLTPPKEVFAHGWLLVGGEKMSKTRLNQIHPLDLVETFGSDGFRYHFLRDQPFGPDGDFSYEAMVSRYNSDLANNFGNLANRVVTMAVNYLDGVVPDLDNWGELQIVSEQTVAKYTDFLANTDFEHGFGAVWDLIRTTNAFIEQNEPWVLHKAGDNEAVARVLGPCIQVLGTMAVCAWPLIPRAADELWRRLGQSGSPGDLRLPEATVWPVIAPGSQLVKGGPLFPRINDEA